MDSSVEIAQKFELSATKNEQTALDLLAEATGISKLRIKDAMNKGAVWWTLNGKQLRLRRATKKLLKGSKIQFFYDPQVLSRKPETPDCILDAGRYSIWYKPSGMLAQGSQWGDHCSILRWVEVNGHTKNLDTPNQNTTRSLMTEKLNTKTRGEVTAKNASRDCFLVHRLDAHAAGLMMLAHDSKMAATLSQLFQGRDIKKCYQAWVKDSGHLLADSMTITNALDGKSAITQIKKIATADHKALLDITIETGRKHQIRRHLSDIGHPIIGDSLYGTKSESGLQLLAYKLEFCCPITKEHQIIELEKRRQYLGAFAEVVAK